MRPPEAAALALGAALALPPPAPPVQAVAPAPGETCPAGAGLPAARPVGGQTGLGGAAAPGPPVWLSPSGVVYLRLRHRPLPRLTAVVAVALNGRPLWSDPLPPDTVRAALTAWQGRVVLLRVAAGRLRVDRLDPATGRPEGGFSLGWPAGASPSALPDGEGGLLVATAGALPEDDGGADPEPGWTADLAPTGRLRWSRAGLGTPVVAQGGGAVLGRILPVPRPAAVLSAVDAAGRLRWQARLALPEEPLRLGFLAADGEVIWWASGPFGGAVGAAAAATGRLLWRRPVNRWSWRVVAGRLVGGGPPWDPQSSLVWLSPATGRRLPGAAPGAPVAAVGPWLFTVAASARPAPTATGRWLGPTGSPRGQALSLPAAWASPPYWLFCTAKGAWLTEAAHPAVWLHLTAAPPIRGAVQKLSRGSPGAGGEPRRSGDLAAAPGAAPGGAEVPPSGRGGDGGLA